MRVDCKWVGRMPYKECWEYQQSLFNELLAKQGDGSDFAGTIIFVEHPAVYTLGKSGNINNMLIDEARLKALGAEFYHIDRGGDITFHGEGQVVCYPILDLEKLGIGLRRYVELLEQSVIETVAEYGIDGGRLEGATGVWLCDEMTNSVGEKLQQNWRKICAIGVKASRFVTMHGLALNASTDLKWFTMINPCGFVDKGVTSISKELGREVSFDEASKVLCEKLLANFNVERI
ncbi:MAG: lipoyl(octanoyl) transferase LipB [Alistipes sp.]|nr:lipoyl(octanoyl) transferase LipB [Rikenellaceae bacterium]MBR1961818.1 lipoyl(octanoyl) transferase LipB [Alistipes sp.]